MWANASSLNIAGDIQPVVTDLAPLFSASHHANHLLPLAQDHSVLPTESFFGMLQSSVLTLHSLIKHLLNIYSLLGSIVSVEGGAQNTKEKDLMRSI